MNTPSTLDAAQVAHLCSWEGRSETQGDDISAAPLRGQSALLDRDDPRQTAGSEVPPLWHWLYFLPQARQSQIGPDGHPLRGGFLPPVPLPRRMWAGGRLEFHAPLLAGAAAHCVSTIDQVEEKAGRSGQLLFVTLCHEYFQDGRLALREEQDIVYREPTPPKLSSGQPLPEAEWREPVAPTSTLLFRYSAVTFNGHRIHYDYPYVTATEGYPGLVVHGPLIATLSLGAFCRANPEARLRHFAYRGLRPLIAPQPFEVGGRISAPGQAELWAGDGGGLAQHGAVQFD